MRTSIRRILAVLCLMLPGEASAALAASSANDLCSPTDDPCVVNTIYDVTGVLDFGFRKLLIVPGGLLRGAPSVDIFAGAVEIAVGISANNNIEADASASGYIQITAHRACSGDATTRCVSDSQCSWGGLGTCSTGSPGTILADGIISANARQPSSVALNAAGDIVLKRRVSANAIGAGGYGGAVWIESYQGSVTTTGQISASSDLGTFDYETGLGGQITMHAALDLTISNVVRVWGAAGGGQIEVGAKRDLLLTSDIISDAGAGVYAGGGWAELEAGRDITVATVAGGDPTQEIGTDGGGDFVFSYGYGYWQTGYGGYQYLRAGESLALGPDSTLHSHGGPGATGGYISLYAYAGDITVEGAIRAQGLPPASGGDSGAGGGQIRALGYGDLTLGAASVLDTSSPLGQGWVLLDAPGKMNLHGLIDVHGTGSGAYVYASPGVVGIGYDTAGDVTISGRIRGGGEDSADHDWLIRACRLHLTSSAILDQALDSPNPASGGIDIEIFESMIADEGSKITTDPSAGTRTRIFYRDPKKPPLLGGTISPPPLLLNSGGIGCPVCGNGEIDYSESCDDGNTISGDGCRSDCQDEGCLAETPGYPAVDLCDDGVPCSTDSCDPVAHSCHNVNSCDDEVTCTIDLCTNEGCQHTVSDSLCNDYNDCTADLCNAATGCVYADLTGGSCSNGDFCAAPGVCEHGTCDNLPAMHTTGSALKAKSSSHGDRLKAQFRFAGDLLGSNPSNNGAKLVLANAVDKVVWQAELPATGWSAEDGSGRSFRFTARDIAVGDAGKGSSVIVKYMAVAQETRVVLRIRANDLRGIEDQDKASLSLLLGSSPESAHCVTARRIPCRARGATTTCRG